MLLFHYFISNIWVYPRQWGAPVGEVLPVLDRGEEKVQQVALLPVGGDHALTDLVLHTAGLVDDENVGTAHPHRLHRERAQSVLTEREIKRDCLLGKQSRQSACFHSQQRRGCSHREP